MSLSDCEKCWDTPCTCGWYWRNSSPNGLARHIMNITGFREYEDRRIILQEAIDLLDEEFAPEKEDPRSWWLLELETNYIWKPKGFPWNKATHYDSPATHVIRTVEDIKDGIEKGKLVPYKKEAKVIPSNQDNRA